MKSSGSDDKTSPRGGCSLVSERRPQAPGTGGSRRGPPSPPPGEASRRLSGPTATPARPFGEAGMEGEGRARAGPGGPAVEAVRAAAVTAATAGGYGGWRDRPGPRLPAWLGRPPDRGSRPREQAVLPPAALVRTAQRRCFPCGRGPEAAAGAGGPDTHRLVNVAKAGFPGPISGRICGAGQRGASGSLRSQAGPRGHGTPCRPRTHDHSSSGAEQRRLGRDWEAGTRPGGQCGRAGSRSAGPVPAGKRQVSWENRKTRSRNRRQNIREERVVKVQ